jgi:hypothetical protein
MTPGPRRTILRAIGANGPLTTLFLIAHPLGFAGSWLADARVPTWAQLAFGLPLGMVQPELGAKLRAEVKGGP